MIRRSSARLAAAPLALLLAGCTTLFPSPPPQPPTAQGIAAQQEAAIDTLLARMTVERKVAQLVMPDILTITPEDVRRYRFGTILNGGNSGPGNNDKAPAPEWLKLADTMWEASTAPMEDGGPVIPLLWATDAVHGHSNVPGATIFPHNIALGAAGDEDLVRRIGRATAAEIAVTGIDWTFAPTIAVARDDRWGRTYESYGEDALFVGRLGAAMVEGLQGRPGTPEFLAQDRVIATAKHFFGDGGTNGVDQGNARGTMPALKAIHATPYYPAFAADVQTVMASFSSINGEKMHGSKPLLTDLLRGEMGFKGLTVGDWNGHGQVPGCTNTDCPQALMAGLDVFMAPEEWKGLHERLVAQVNAGTVPQARLDEAVRRVLRLKSAAALFDRPKPSARLLGGKFDLIGSADHRAIAREAVRKSLVLLKNDGVLPVRAGATVLVAGTAADNIAQQSGGWSITWQGGGALTNTDFPGATSIQAGIAAALAHGGGRAILAPDGHTSERPDAAIVVFGEEPYAEFSGDRKDFAFQDDAALATMRRLRAQGIPVVAVFLSGRPLWVNRFLAEADAFVAAWLPGSEGAGIADVLIGGPNREVRHDFTGRLPFSWPARCDADAGNGSDGFPLFRRGEGYGYAAPPPAGRTFDAACALLDRQDQERTLFARGSTSGLTLSVQDASGTAPLPNGIGQGPAGTFSVRGVDRHAQEDSRQLAWTGPASLMLKASNATGQDLLIDYAIDVAPAGPVRFGSSLDLTETLVVAAGKGWRQMRLPAPCLGRSPWTLRAEAPVTFRISAMRSVPARTEQQGCAGTF
ncbi:glycoside hydrolase family 3 protein [Sphingomonas sp. LHG3406-1]|uniref:glycoside hydrolase family 3 protein n=1 Tax=Sphingomonas sp. LHG3406-1 TaxID=2804617 RepID=UPI002613B392|nr:glycoside hydrolase family 3 protein [Sphingomonas sp. LHG3406-1]